MDKLFCIEVTREMEDLYVIHHRFAKKPTREEVLELVLAKDIGYEDDYGKINYYEISM